jgi:3-deoxy-D-manno-octulosonic-acid transferase
LISLAYLGLFPYLRIRYREGFHQRIGKLAKGQFNNTKDSPIWVHGVSVGEVQAAFPFIYEARKGGCSLPIFLSTVTCTGKKMAEKLLSELVDGHFYFPWDVPWIIRRFLDDLTPRIYVGLETEIWPCLLHELKKREIPSFLVNGRFSERSFKKACRSREFWKETLECFSRILVRSSDDADKLYSLGVSPDKIKIIGDVKIDALLLRRDRVDSGALRDKLHISEEEQCLIAGSTHNGEEAVVLEAFDLVKKQFPKAKLILVPRHPERARDVCALIGEKFGVSLYSGLKERWDILVIDEVGLLFELYSLADVAFVGGSLVPKGGQNVLEPACFGVPIAFGPHMEDFSMHASELSKIGIAQVVEDSASLARLWLSFLKMKTESRKRAVEYVESLGGAAGLAVREILDCLKGRI